MKRRPSAFTLMGALAVGSLAVTLGIGPVGANGHQKTSQGGYLNASRAVALTHVANTKSLSSLKSTENGTAAVTTTNIPTKAPTTTPPTSIAANCAVDVGQALGDWLSSLPANSTVTLPSGACYRIDSSLIIHDTSGLTVNGNGALLSQTTPAPVHTKQGIVYLRQNADLTLNGLKVAGAYKGTNGGAGHEGAFGLFMEANHGVNVTGMNMSNIQGDFIILDPPHNYDTGNDQSLNTDVNIQSSTFTNAGYHGITIESVNGLTIEHSTFSNMATDAIDTEYDVYSSAFDAQGNAEQAAQDNITIAGNTFTNFPMTSTRPSKANRRGYSNRTSTCPITPSTVARACSRLRAPISPPPPASIGTRG